MAVARLTAVEIDRIVGILTSWEGKLSWELLLRRVRPILKRPFTRQGLDKHEPIRIAFKQAKERLRTSSKTAILDRVPPELALAQRRIDSLVAEVKVLKGERDRFLEKFATWLYNARSRGISEVDLNRSLPSVDRRGSDKSMR